MSSLLRYNLLIICNTVAGLSILLAPGLHLIPIPILFGVLLYLGVVSMYGLQMVDRFVMLFMPAKHHPDVSYVRKVRWVLDQYYRSAVHENDFSY